MKALLHSCLLLESFSVTTTIQFFPGPIPSSLARAWNSFRRLRSASSNDDWVRFRWSYFSWCICFNFLFDIPPSAIHSVVLPLDRWRRRRATAHNKTLCKYTGALDGCIAHKPIIILPTSAVVAEGGMHFLRTNHQVNMSLRPETA